MNRKVWIALSVVFFALLLIFPIYMIVDAVALANYAVSNPLDDTQTRELLQQATVAHQTLLTALAIGEVIVMVLFAISLRGIFKP